MKDIYVGRQAIYDRSLEVYAYELLLRQGNQDGSNVNQLTNGDFASSEVLLNCFVEIGLERIVGAHRAFINLTRNLLLDHPQLAFDKERVVMEILEDIPVDEPLVTRVRELAEQGYTIALDDYAFEEKWDPLLPHAHIIKVEIPALTPEQLQAGLPKLRQHKLLLLAEKIETEEEFQQCLELGFDLFQGYHFSRPKVVEDKRLEENQMVIMQLVSRLNDPQVEIRDLEHLIAQDASLSYKILRFINSAAVGMPRRVESIHQAVVFMGLTRIRAWASLLVLSRVANKPQDYFTTALVRAHMCQRLLSKSGSNCSAEMGFSVGLLSILDLLMERPLAEIIGELGLSDELNTALLDHAGPAGRALVCTLNYESGNIQPDDRFELDLGELTEIFLNASKTAFAEAQALGEA
jgi:EAL and modified HD-GYP domain-containing signal transduction protein